MGSVQNFFTSRDNNTDPATYVGQLDRLWYNPVTNSIFVSNGTTPGGVPVALATGANIVANIVTLNTITSTGGNINVSGNLVISGNISPASNVKIGGIKAGPGANISNDGTLTIDTAGLPLSFGDFTANNNILTLVNVDQNMVLATQGNAEVQLVGNIGFYKSNGLPPNVSNRYFIASEDGQITILVPTEDPFAGGVEIIGSSTGNFITPGQPGAMMHLTGNPGVPTRLYIDGNAEYATIVARRFNGNVAAPTQVLADEDVFRINATAATTSGVGNVAMAQIRITALENQTITAQGSEITFTVTPVGQSALNRVEVANITVANGVSATKFTTAGTMSATSNITGGNLITVGQVSATGNISTSNFFIGNGTFITGINAFGNINANGVAILATTGSSSMTVTPGNNIVVNGDNGTKTMTIAVSSAPTFSGNITGGNILTGGLVSASGNVTAGNVNAYVVLPAGTANKAPLTFTAGNILAVDTPGAINYDGRVFYGTPQGQERGLLKTAQTYVLNTDYALTDQTAMQSMFGVSAAVSNTTRYAYVINAVIYKTANNITMSYAIDGNAVLTRHTYQTLTTVAVLGSIGTPNLLKNILTTGFGTGVTVTAALNGAGYYSIQITGLINVTTGGTWNPLIGFSGLPGAGSYVAAGSSIEIYPVGTGNTTVNIGNWT